VNEAGDYLETKVYRKMSTSIMSFCIQRINERYAYMEGEVCVSFQVTKQTCSKTLHANGIIRCGKGTFTGNIPSVIKEDLLQITF
jgi:hypothetical protein